MTRSLQSPSLLVNPHATRPLLPTTSHGRPGSVTPVRRRAGRPGSAAIVYEARYQIDGTPIARCMSLATRAAPVDVCAPSTAQLLLPALNAGSSGGESAA